MENKVELFDEYENKKNMYDILNIEIIGDNKFNDFEDIRIAKKGYPHIQNQMEICKSEVKASGFIVISVTQENLFDVKSNCDTVFEEDNFLASVPCLVKEYEGLHKVQNYFLVYTKNKNKIKEEKLEKLQTKVIEFSTTNTNSLGNNEVNINKRKTYAKYEKLKELLEFENEILFKSQIMINN